MTKFDRTSTAEQVTEGLDLAGRTILVTGCSSGLGLETMRVLALRGARVLGTARTEAKAAAACAQVEGDAVPLVCELSDPASVRATVASVQEPLHAIIANAGVMALPELQLQHGVEAHMFTNHVGHYLLVMGLLDRLAESARVVMLSSAAHGYARSPDVRFDDLSWTSPYAVWVAYGRSKLANILFAKELAKRLPAGQTANAVHPGVIDTPLWRHIPPPEADRMRTTMRFKTIAQGAATEVFVATHPSVAGVTGAYFDNCAVKPGSELARDEALAARLWRATEAVVAGL